MNLPSVIILDFDGTLVESVGIKDDAFRAVFSEEEPDHLEAIMALHLKLNHVLRFEKFEMIYRDILKRPYGPEDRKRLSDKLSAQIKDAIITAPEVPGASDFVDQWKGRVALYLLSMSPDDELREILDGRDMTDNFKAIYSGGFGSKADAVRDILARENCAPTAALMIGDAAEDQQTAHDLGLRFIGRDAGKPLDPARDPVVQDFHQISSRLQPGSS